MTVGGPGEIRTRNQQIKRSRSFLKPYINQWPKSQKRPWDWVCDCCSL